MSLEGAHVVVCDDEADMRETVGEYLERRGCRVSLAADARALYSVLDQEESVAAVILDVTMPGEDGFTVLKKIRSSHDLAVIMLTASGELIDRVLGLELGADDYLGKPVELRELEARLKTVLRRIRNTKPAVSQSAVSRVGPHALDKDAAQLRDPEGHVIPLTPMEFRTLELFLENRGRVLSRDQLLRLAEERGWEAFDRSIDLRISRLRRKIEPNPSEPTIIRTVRGIGYILDAAQD